MFVRTLVRIATWSVALCAIAGVIVAVVAPGTYIRAAEAIGWKQKSSDIQIEDIRFAKIKRGSLSIGMVANGSLQAVKSHVIRMDFTRQAKLAWIIPEGTDVQAGDKVIEFDSEPIKADLENVERDMESSVFNLKSERENLAVDEASAESRVADALTNVDNAEENLRKYKQSDAPDRVKSLAEAVTAAEAKLEEAKVKYRETMESADESMSLNEDERKKMDLAMESARKNTDSAEDALRLAWRRQRDFRVFEYPRRIVELETAVRNAVLSQRRTEIDAAKGVESRKLSIRRNEANVDRLEKRIALLKENIQKCVVTAPVAGSVLYSVEGYAGRGAGTEIKVGMDVWMGMPLITIPDTSAFEISIGIPEEYRRKVAEGSNVNIVIAALSSDVLEGKLKSITQNPAARYNPGEAFSGIIELKNSGQGMSVGLTARVEIVAEQLDDVLLAPIEGVFIEGGKPVCFVQKDDRYEMTEVVIGKNNDSFVEIVSGLNEGETIFLVDPRRHGEGDTTGAPPATEPPAEPPAEDLEARAPAFLPEQRHG